MVGVPQVKKALAAAGSVVRDSGDEDQAKLKKEKDRHKAEERVAMKKRREQAVKAKTHEPRSWSDASGQFHVTAAFRGVVNKVVKLELEDGRVISVPLEKLSDDDQECIRQQKY